VKLVCEYGTVENILARADELKGKMRDNIVAGSEQLLLSKRLATIETDAPVEFEAGALRMEDPDCATLREIYRELDFNMFIREMDTGRTTPFNRVVSHDEREGERRACVGVGIAGGETPKENTRTHGENAGAPQAAIQTDLFGTPVAEAVNKVHSAPADDLFAASSAYETLATSAHDYRTVESAAAFDELVA
jgi:DNA polymerase-1